MDRFAALLPDGPFELQLEGGEPTVHPDFWAFVALARAAARCTRLVVCTNGVRVPRDLGRLDAWLARLGEPLTIKLSVNHHLLDHDPGLLALAGMLVARAGPRREVVINVRLRRGVEDDDRRVREAVEAAGLLPHANVFFLQRYGFAEGEAAWDAPFVVADAFSMVNPDGTVFGPDLVARSEGMRRLG